MLWVSDNPPVSPEIAVNFLFNALEINKPAGWVKQEKKKGSRTGIGAGHPFDK